MAKELITLLRLITLSPLHPRAVAVVVDDAVRGGYGYAYVVIADVDVLCPSPLLLFTSTGSATVTQLVSLPASPRTSIASESRCVRCVFSTASEQTGPDRRSPTSAGSGSGPCDPRSVSGMTCAGHSGSQG